MSQRIYPVLIVLFLALHSTQAIADCTPDPPSDGDTVTCVDTSTGYDARGATDLTIVTDGSAVLDDSDPGFESAIDVGDGNTVTIGADATINVVDANGFGIRGGNDNIVDNQGTITITGANGRGISIGENTTGILPNGAVNSFEIFANSVGSIALETGMNSGVATFGLIEVNGDGGRGISAADHSDSSIAANITNIGIIDVTGNNAYAIKAGESWVQGFVVDGVFQPSVAEVQNRGDINVMGDNSFGIFSDNNSFVSNTGLIDVTGVDSIGVSLFGNDLLDRFSLVEAGDSLDVYDFDNRGTVRGGPDSGPLIVFRSFVAGKENRIRNFPSSQIIADTTNLGSTDRGIAIRGSAGDEFVFNLGTIVGDIEFGDGDDRYVHRAGATMTGTIFGGNGNDQLVLTGGAGLADSFDVSSLSEFEGILIIEGASWEITNTAGFGGPVEIGTRGRFKVSTPITLQGAFSVIESSGILELTLDETMPALTVEGLSTLDGTLVINVNVGSRLAASATPYRVFAANGGLTGAFANPVEFPGALGPQVFTAIYDAMGISVLLEEGLVLAARNENQRAIAQNLVDIDAAGGADADLQRLIDDLNDSTGTIANVYAALDPEVYDAQTTMIVEAGRRVAKQLLDRPRECREGAFDRWQGTRTKLPCHSRSWSPWLSGVAGFRSRDQFVGHTRYDSTTGGLIFGLDAPPIGNLDLTFAISSQRGTLNAAYVGENTSTLTDLSGHFAWTRGRLRLQGVVSWGHGFHQDRRLIRASETMTPLDTRGTTEHQSDRVTIAAEAGFRFEVGPIDIEPVASLDWAWVHQQAIHEKEAGGFGIRIASRDDNIASINAGIRLSTTYKHDHYLSNLLEWMDGVWRPTIDLRWRQIVTGDKRDINARFAGSPDTVSDFTINGKEDAGGFEIGAGVSFTPKRANRLRFDLRYEAFRAPHTFEQNLVAEVRIGF